MMRRSKEGGRPLDKFSPRPSAGERLSVLLSVPLSEVADVTEENDPRKITLTVRPRGGAGRGRGGGYRYPGAIEEGQSAAGRVFG